MRTLFYLFFIAPLCTSILAASLDVSGAAPPAASLPAEALTPGTLQHHVLAQAAENLEIATRGLPPAAGEFVTDNFLRAAHFVSQPAPPTMGGPLATPPISDRDHLKNIGKACACGGYLYAKGMYISPTPITRACACCCAPIAFLAGTVAGVGCAAPWVLATPCTPDDTRRELAKAVVPTSGSVLIADLLCFGLCCPLQWLPQ